MSPDSHPPRLWPWAAALLLAAPLALALPLDRDQPTRIVSDRFQADQRQGVAIYEGKVELVQGSLKIEADRLTLYRDENNRVREVLAEGTPARYRQKPGPDQPEITAEAHSIRYTLESELIQLNTRAFLSQDGATMSGDQISYFIGQDRVVADAEADSRIEMVIPPRNRQD